MIEIPKLDPSIDIPSITAHPDDELLCAGVIAHHSRNSRSVVIAVVMAGDQGELAATPRRVGTEA